LSQDKGPLKWALILALACLPPALHIFEKNTAKLTFFQVDANKYLWQPFCIPYCIGLSYYFAFWVIICIFLDAGRAVLVLNMVL